MTKTERLILMNQCRILARLFPEEAAQHEADRRALEQGYPPEYPTSHMRDELPDSVIDEIHETLTMYSGIVLSLKKLPPEHLLQNHIYAKFDGFSVRDEPGFTGLVRYLVDRGDFSWLRNPASADFASPAPMREKYARMLAVWKTMPPDQRHDLKEDQLRMILEA